MLQDRYKIMRELGRGGQAVTHLAVDIQSEKLVAIKELKWEDMDDWKAQELFEREAEVLAHLEHPGIPAFENSFEENNAFYLVQEYIQGKSVQELLEEGYPWPQKAILRLLHDVLDILEYLHNFVPPILHRDIKPGNILLHPDGRFVLVDFGVVQVEASRDVGNSTVVGSPGYMPMEQLLGRTVPASDLYSLAATIVHVASKTPPMDLEVSRGCIQFKKLVDLPDHTVEALTRALDPMVEDRIQNVAEFRSKLRPRKPIADHFGEILESIEGIDEAALEASVLYPTAAPSAQQLTTTPTRDLVAADVRGVQVGLVFVAMVAFGILVLLLLVLL